MTTTTHTRRITFDEAVAEMDRRGKIIERLEARIGEMERLLRGLRAYAAVDLPWAITKGFQSYAEELEATLAHIDAALGDPPGADGSDIFHHPIGSE